MLWYNHCYRVNLKKNVMTFELFTKTIDFYGDYDMAGRMMVIDLKGTGKATLNFSKSSSNSLNYSIHDRLTFAWTIANYSSKVYICSIFGGFFICNSTHLFCFKYECYKWSRCWQSYGKGYAARVP